MANVYRNGVKITPDNFARLLEEARAQLKRTPATVVVVPEPKGKGLVSYPKQGK